MTRHAASEDRWGITPNQWIPSHAAQANQCARRGFAFQHMVLPPTPVILFGSAGENSTRVLPRSVEGASHPRGPRVEESCCPALFSLPEATRHPGTTSSSEANEN